MNKKRKNNGESIVFRYHASLDKKNRITIKGHPIFEQYHVKIYSDGSILMTPFYPNDKSNESFDPNKEFSDKE